ncbi:hypothetical protein C8F04DRAFT_1035202 [Mycena alexandri]|uniref:Transmembrane protein 135 N-terminal domain-containing protein n=1 Tax=Mycena alexandri TaxID=1745969 RepID=A0AAD6T2H3_9AGAR|nr:hypothetical protein C8F04DRAFT_1035202 [Mycena alexandri]
MQGANDAAPSSSSSLGPHGTKRPTFRHNSESQSMMSFENLVSLVSHQERMKYARKALWRDKGQPVVELPTFRACLEHAGYGGMRSAGLAFSARASFNVFLTLIFLRKAPRAKWFALFRRAIFGTDSFRFAAMLGTFAALYKFLLNALPILIPAVRPSSDDLSSPFGLEDGDESTQSSGIATPGLRERAPRLSLSAHAQMVLVRKRTRRWHSALAGAISGGLAVLWEKRNRQTFLAQQIFVRGLQGSYNALSEKTGLHIPHGAIIVFSLACGQIMYAFFLRPDTLPRSYIAWIQEASKASPDSFEMNRIAVREHIIDLPALDRVIAIPNVTPSNLSSLLDLRARAVAGASDLPTYAPCYGLHPTADGCYNAAGGRFVEVVRWMLPIYAALHFVPSILLRWSLFRRDPLHLLKRASIGSLRSSAFLGTFVIICEGVFCIKHNLYERIMALPASSPIRRLLPQRLIDVLISKGTWWFSGFATGLALLIEDRRRRAELAMYVLPKGLESLWAVARGHGFVRHTGNWGEGVLTGVGMGMVMTIYQNDPQHLSGLVRQILYQFIGPN